MYRLLVQKCDLLIAELKRIDDIARYHDLVVRLQSTSGEAAIDPEFQRVYRVYWRMNVARLSPAFYERYFDLLARGVRSGRVNLRTAARDRTVIGDDSKRSLQFSFVTKLCHMVDRRLPVYDRFIAAFYFYAPPAADKPFDTRLDRLMEFYSFLQHEYARIIEHGLLDLALVRLRADFHLSDLITQERAIDWLLWAWVVAMQGGAQLRGEVLYD
jgi:hypothetical protein